MAPSFTQCEIIDSINSNYSLLFDWTNAFNNGIENELKHYNIQSQSGTDNNGVITVKVTVQSDYKVRAIYEQLTQNNDMFGLTYVLDTKQFDETQRSLRYAFITHFIYIHIQCGFFVFCFFFCFGFC